MPWSLLADPAHVKRWQICNNDIQKKLSPEKNRSSILQLRPNYDFGVNLEVLSRVATVFPHRAQKVLRGHCVGSQLLCVGCQFLEYPSPSE